MSVIRQTKGFTIVELLIVIVVIAILATITIVAYNGIQNRANDTAIQSDLNNFAKSIQLAAIDLDYFPPGGASRSGTTNTGNSTQLPSFKFTPTKSAYLSTVLNLFYCTGVETSTNENVFRVFARSKSGNLFKYSSNKGQENLGNTFINETVACQGMNSPHTWAYAYNNATSTWYAWAN